MLDRRGHEGVAVTDLGDDGAAGLLDEPGDALANERRVLRDDDTERSCLHVAMMRVPAGRAPVAPNGRDEPAIVSTYGVRRGRNEQCRCHQLRFGGRCPVRARVVALARERGPDQVRGHGRRRPWVGRQARGQERGEQRHGRRSRRRRRDRWSRLLHVPGRRDCARGGGRGRDRRGPRNGRRRQVRQGGQGQPGRPASRPCSSRSRTPTPTPRSRRSAATTASCSRRTSTRRRRRPSARR